MFAALTIAMVWGFGVLLKARKKFLAPVDELHSSQQVGRMEQLSTSCHDVEETAPPSFWRGSSSKGCQLWLWPPWIWFTFDGLQSTTLVCCSWCDAMGVPWSVGCCGAVTFQPVPDPPGCWEWGQAAGTQPSPEEVSWRCEPSQGDSSAMAAVAAPVCGLLSLLSQPLCFGGRVSANGKLTSESGHMCHQQCQGKETGIYPPPI